MMKIMTALKATQLPMEISSQPMIPKLILLTTITIGLLQENNSPAWFGSPPAYCGARSKSKTNHISTGYRQKAFTSPKPTSKWINSVQQDVFLELTLTLFTKMTQQWSSSNGLISLLISDFNSHPSL